LYTAKRKYPSKRAWPSALLLASAGLIPGCTGAPHGCTLIGYNGIIATVTDAVSGTPICDAEVTATHGSSSDREFFYVTPDCKYAGAGEGDYELYVKRAGYGEATQHVHVDSTGGQCERPKTVMVTVGLVAEVSN